MRFVKHVCRAAAARQFALDNACRVIAVQCSPGILLSVVEGEEGVFLLVAEGESVEGPILQIGNTNSRYKFSISAKEFMNQWSKQGPAHHCAIGVGHIADKIEKLGQILGIDVVKIC